MMVQAMVYERQILSRGINMKEFFRITRNALDTDNDETFLHSLIQRNALFGSLEQFSSCLSQEYIEKMIFLEEKIIERLKTERKRMIKDIDEVSRKISTVKAYSALFPIPSMPAFFDLTG